MNPTRWCALIALVVTSLTLHTGCAQQCQQINRGYQEALAREPGQIAPEASASSTTQFGLTLGFGLLGQVASRLLEVVLSQALNMNTKLPLGGGKIVNVAMAGKAVGLKLVPDREACPQCFRVAASLGGDMKMNIPLIGQINVPLRGDLGLVAPLLFDQSTPGRVVIKLDTSRFMDYAKSGVTMQLSGIPEAWRGAIMQTLQRAVLDRFAQQLKPITLATIGTPDFGVAGLRVMPTELSFQGDRNALFVGFSTNLPGFAGQGLDSAQAQALTGTENLAVAIHPGVIKPIIELLMQQDKVPRRYTTDGQSDARGPAHVTINSFGLSQPSAAVTGQGVADASGLNLNFRAWNLVAGATCFWFDALVAGAVTLREGKLRVELSEVKLLDTSAPYASALLKNLVNWRSAEFLDKTRTLLQTSLGEPKLTLPGMGELRLAVSSLDQGANVLVLRSTVGLGASAQREAPSAPQAQRSDAQLAGRDMGETP